MGRNTLGIRKSFLAVDWIMVISLLPILGAGLVTMNSFIGESALFDKQVAWIGIGFIIFFLLSFFDFRFLRRTHMLVGLFVFSVVILIVLLILVQETKGAQSWLNLGFFSFEPADPIKLVLIALLAKYFSRRHIEIAHIRHILVSGFYASVFFFLVLLQPDFGSAIIIFLIWLGMVLASGISKKHLVLVFCVGAFVFTSLWFYVFKEYQKQRVINFIHPLSDIRGTGYNAYQSTIAVGSGEILGKGVGFGTQSRLKFLPEYETDFIFASYAEEWGFVGVLLLLFFYGIVIWRILLHAMRGSTNFEMLFGLGLSILLMSHFFVNIGMNIGLLPVTGITLPFMSYGGTHLITEFVGLGILMGMSRYQRAAHKDLSKNELPGV
ncbi:MAG: Rod shape-determining protein rodA [candidate division CPR1 bacterium GW2011_GWA2_42_17]|uniref:Rod shape-determining protein rodA n=1 Tax=candidate division CPR1 bacterium GW2011_GWA2_42_17 TaxID=1618341 RepID=A0A0G0Z4V3_9BACT|nr:MAG: Rod shape-determining protein rodA [candidate division CPR1 bacterium GW2011_GWA2_42_17]